MKNKKTLLLFMTLIFAFTIFMPLAAYADNQGIEGLSSITVDSNSGTVSLPKKDLNDFINQYKKLIAMICSFLTISMFIAFAWNMSRLPFTADNAQARRGVYFGIISTFVATASLGMITFIMAFFYGAFRS